MIMDFHGMTLDSALQQAESVIGNVRQSGKSVEVEFITGRGVIREFLFNMLEQRGLLPAYKLGNDGVIKVLIE